MIALSGNHLSGSSFRPPSPSRVADMPGPHHDPPGHAPRGQVYKPNCCTAALANASRQWKEAFTNPFCTSSPWEGPPPEQLAVFLEVAGHGQYRCFHCDKTVYGEQFSRTRHLISRHSALNITKDIPIPNVCSSCLTQLYPAVLKFYAPFHPSGMQRFECACCCRNTVIYFNPDDLVSCQYIPHPYKFCYTCIRRGRGDLAYPIQLPNEAIMYLRPPRILYQDALGHDYIDGYRDAEGMDHTSYPEIKLTHGNQVDPNSKVYPPAHPLGLPTHPDSTPILRCIQQRAHEAAHRIQKAYGRLTSRREAKLFLYFLRNFHPHKQGCTQNCPCCRSENPYEHSGTCPCCDALLGLPPPNLRRRTALTRVRDNQSATRRLSPTWWTP